MAQESGGSREQDTSAYYGAERLMEEVHRSEKAISALKKIDAILQHPSKPSELVIKRIIEKALRDEI
jgi:hypothetical protein